MSSLKRDEGIANRSLNDDDIAEDNDQKLRDIKKYTYFILLPDDSFK